MDLNTLLINSKEKLNVDLQDNLLLQNEVINSQKMNDAFKKFETSLIFLYDKTRFLDSAIVEANNLLSNKLDILFRESSASLKKIEVLKQNTINNTQVFYPIVLTESNEYVIDIQTVSQNTGISLVCNIVEEDYKNISFTVSYKGQAFNIMPVNFDKIYFEKYNSNGQTFEARNDGKTYYAVIADKYVQQNAPSNNCLISYYPVSITSAKNIYMFKEQAGQINSTQIQIKINNPDNLVINSMAIIKSSPEYEIGV